MCISVCQYSLVLLQIYILISPHLHIIYKKGAEKLSNYLKGNNSVKHLDLYNNKIGDVGVEHLTKLLSSNSTLQYLGLFGCDIHDRGANLLAEVLYFGHNKSLRKVILTNNPIDDDDILEAIEVALRRNLGERVTDDDYPILFIERLNKKHARASTRSFPLQMDSNNNNTTSRDSVSSSSATPLTPIMTTMNISVSHVREDSVDSPIKRMMEAKHNSMSGNGHMSLDTNTSSALTAAMNDLSGGTDTPSTPVHEDISDNPVKRMMERAGFRTSVMPPPQKEMTAKRMTAWAMRNENKVFGMPLEIILRRKNEPGPYPSFVEDVLSHLEHNCLEVEGLLRIPGHTGDMDKLKAAIDQGLRIDFDALDTIGKPHTLCGLIKSFTRELPEPLLTFDYFDQFIEAAKKPTASAQTQELEHLVSMLPVPYRLCLGRIIQFFNRVIESPETKMSPSTIATCFGMNLMRMRPDQEDTLKLAQNTKFINKVCELLITNANVLFESKITLNAPVQPVSQPSNEADKKRISALQFENGALKRKVEQLTLEKKQLEQELESETAALKREVEELKREKQRLMNLVNQQSS